MINFSLDLKTRIYFGNGSIKNLKTELKPYNKLLLLTGSGSVKKHGIYDAVISELAGIEIFELSGVKPNPSVDSVYEGIEICRKNNIEFILAAGGGSVIDAAKAIAAGVVFEGDVWDLFTDNSKFKGAIKTGCILTIAATGSETNKNSIITNEKTCEKLGLRHDGLRPEFAILDPTYTYTLPPRQTAAGVADIMAHVFEQYFSNTKDAFMTDRISEGILKTCIKYGPVVMEDPKNYEARAEIMWASTIALNGLLSCGKETDWASHMIAHELSAFYDLNHGTALAILFPNWMRQVADYPQRLEDGHCPSGTPFNADNQVLDEPRLWKFRDYAVNVWGLSPKMNERELAEMAINKTREFFNSLGLPSCLSQVDINDEHFEKFVETLIRRGRTGTFKKLDKEDLISIYRRSL